MKAVIHTKYGPPDVLRIKELESPHPKEDEVLIEVRASAVSATSAIFRRGNQAAARLFTGVFKPRSIIPGFELAGEVVAVGRSVARFEVGDKVYGAMDHSGAHAEYVCMPEDGVLAPMPANLTFEQAAAVCDGALTALPFLRDEAKVEAGQSVLVNGAAGAIGTFAVQLAKYYGAEVTGVCSASNAALVEALGADQVIDYNRADFAENEAAYDVIFDTVGKRSYAQCRRALKPHGVYLSTVLSVSILLDMLWTSRRRGKRAVFAATGMRPARDRAEDLRFLKGLAEASRIEPVIDRYYPMDEVEDAHRYIETGHKKGSLILTLRPEAPRRRTSMSR